MIRPGTETKWGIVSTVWFGRGERYYFCISKDKVVSMIPASTIEPEYLGKDK